MARGASGPAFSYARASGRWLTIWQGVTRSLPIMYDWVLVSDLAPCGTMLASRWIAGDDATWLRVALLLVRALGHYVPLAETLSRCDSTVGSNFATQRV
jgi:hypothetical protein